MNKQKTQNKINDVRVIKINQINEWVKLDIFMNGNAVIKCKNKMTKKYNKSIFV